MTWRRFTSGNFGALSARQYSEVQDAVSALTQRSGVSSAIRRPSLDTPMLVRIKGIYGQSLAGEPATGQGTEVIPATAYLFEQVFVRFNRASGTVEIAARDYGTRSRQGEGQDESLTLVAIDPRPFSNIPENSLATVYPLAVDAGDGLNDVPDQQGLYMVLRAFNPPVVAVYQITAQAGQVGHYFGIPIPEAGTDIDYGTEPVEIVNLYETGNYYGALGMPNPCAQLEPRALGIGDIVPIIVFNDTYYTMAPVAFSSTCVPCSPTPALASATDTNFPVEQSVAGIMMRG